MVYGATLRVKEGQEVKAGDVLLDWTPSRARFSRRCAGR